MSGTDSYGIPNESMYNTLMTDEERQEAQQELYYHHCIAEFYGMLKVFGTKKVMEDLAKFKASVEPSEDKPRIQLL